MEGNNSHIQLMPTYFFNLLSLSLIQNITKQQHKIPAKVFFANLNSIYYNHNLNIIII